MIHSEQQPESLAGTIADGWANATADALKHPESYMPMGYGTLPLSAALHVSLVEFGVHRHDLHRALGIPWDLSGAVAEAGIKLLGGLLPAIGTPQESAIEFELAGATGIVNIAWTDGGWMTPNAPDPDVRVSGPDSAVLLFALNRFGADELPLSIEERRAPVASFRTAFPSY